MLPFSKRKFTVVVLFCFTLVVSDSLCGAETKKHSFIIISDTQAPMWFEKIFVRTHQNEMATDLLFDAITKDTSISSVFFLGDLTAMSSIDNNWKKVDSFLIKLAQKNISTYGIAGNHDYLLTSAKGEANLKKRFPDFQRTGYTIRLNGFAFILLNSNFNVLSDSEEVQQLEWYLKELKSLESDTTIQIIAVACHHSPFSNSKIVGSSEQVRDKFVTPFSNSNKGALFISGHAHTFQHFQDTTTRKHFIVTGGGGGLLHTLNKERMNGLKDLTDWQIEYRMFHYLRCTYEENVLTIVVYMLKENFEGPDPIYKIVIPLNNK